MRPDEEANRAEIERDQRFRSNVAKGVGTAATLGAGAATARIMPFLSKFIPVDLAMKGLTKVSPKIADFLKRGQSMGLNVEEGIQYIRDSISPKEEKKSPETGKNPKENRNVIEQYSPELHQFILGEMQNGRSPLEAGAIATLGRKGDPDFKPIISKLTKDHKTSWSSILESVYGAQGGQKAPNNPNPQQNQQQQPNQPGPGQQALMDILAKINQKLGQ